ncbi:peptide-methionine (S)-S-oxide reductase MsrA [Fodinibius roseus]|nr:peptide-methionine (S)-S-oxide reductase MsrA [Fodinibius roseus]
MNKRYTLLLAGILIFAACNSKAQKTPSMQEENIQPSDTTLQEATFGAGCFWCVEAIFEEVKGVKSVVAGYAGGQEKNPTYRQVSSGSTGHAEVTRIVYDPSVVSYEQLLEVLWHTHNPTTKNRQGADVGPQYRSVIFYHNDDQKIIAEKSLKKTDQSDLWEDPIVTEIEPITNYSRAENYHQNYYENNPNAGYCTVVIAPKLKKFRKEFSHMLKDS